MQVIPPAQLQELADMICERMAPIMVDLAGTAARNPPPTLNRPAPIAQTPTPKRKRSAGKVQNF